MKDYADIIVLLDRSIAATLVGFAAGERIEAVEDKQ